MATNIQLRKQKEGLNKNGRKKLNGFSLQQLHQLLNEEARPKFQRKIRNRIRDKSRRKALA